MSSPHADPRISALVDWLEGKLSLDIQKLETASSDASFRRYFRVRHRNGCHIVMDAPPEKENTAAFMHVAKLFKAAGIPVPDIYASDTAQGFLLLEDFGNRCLLDILNHDNVALFYRQAIDNLFTLQTSIDKNTCQLPEYDLTLLTRELAIFSEWFLEKRLNLSLPVPIKNPLWQLLTDSALAQPQVCVHRDYHSRNLMVRDDNSLGIIDFQDAVIGPITYDLASLLRDCYISWPATLVAQWLQAYYQRLVSAHLLTVDFREFKRWFDLMGLQRHLKAVGIFCRLHLRDGKSTYLADIPRTLDYILAVCADYAELSEFHAFLQHQVLPAYRAAE